jgi:tetratricopeptide (TPR) repeat protein
MERLEQNDLADAAATWGRSGAGGLRCVFSSSSVTRIGTGVTARRQTLKTYWYVEQKGPDAYDVFKLGPEFVPQARERVVTQEELVSGFSPEVELYHQKVEPAMRRLQRIIAKAERHRSRGESYSAELEYRNALKIDNENVRATFGLGLVYLARSDKANSETVFRTLLSLDAAFEEEHKHLFNEFGIALRKSGLYTEAVEYYRRAGAISPKDEHLHFNLARAHYELDEYGDCIAALADCLGANPRMDEAVSMLRHLARLAEDTAFCVSIGKPPLLERIGPRGPRLLELLKKAAGSGRKREEHIQALRALLAE